MRAPPPPTRQLGASGRAGMEAVNNKAYDFKVLLKVKRIKLTNLYNQCFLRKDVDNLSII